jgi:hypothetical protein
MIGAERSFLMTELNVKQMAFANAWMGMFDYDYEAINEQLKIKVNFSIPGFSPSAAHEIWDYIRDLTMSHLN